MTVQFERGAEYLMAGTNTDAIVGDFREYFASYTGRHFETFASRSDDDQFTADDLAAVATLSVPLSGRAATDLLIDRADEFNGLLGGSDMPAVDADIRTVEPEVLADDGPLATLYEELKTLDDVGYVRASKLLAAKRPALVPIRDSIVEKFLGAGSHWWAPYRELACVDGLADRVRDLSAGVPESVTLLRRFDVALWMAGKRQITA